jgi:hypothetical protein
MKRVSILWGRSSESMRHHPSRKFSFREGSGGEVREDINDVFRVCFELAFVDFKKRGHQREAGALEFFRIGGHSVVEPREDAAVFVNHSSYDCDKRPR